MKIKTVECLIFATFHQIFDKVTQWKILLWYEIQDMVNDIACFHLNETIELTETSEKYSNNSF